MQVLRYCRSCSGPRPRAARRCPWCHQSYEATGAPPEHLFAVYDRRPIATPKPNRELT